MLRFHDPDGKRIWTLVGVILVAFAALGMQRLSLPPLQVHFGQLQRIEAWGPWAPVVSLLIMVGQSVLPIPGESVGFVNGAVFGFWCGLAISWLGMMSSASFAFAVGRAFRRRPLGRGRAKAVLAYADSLVRGNWKVALAARFVPFSPFGLFNFALGRADVPWAAFLWTTAVGVLPMTAVVVILGSTAAAHHVLG